MINLYRSGNCAGAGEVGGAWLQRHGYTDSSVCHAAATSQEAGRPIRRFHGDLSEDPLFTIMAIRHSPIKSNETC